MKTQQESDRHNPWKTGVIATGVALGILVTGGLTFAALNEADVFEKQPVFLKTIRVDHRHTQRHRNLLKIAVVTSHKARVIVLKRQ